MSRAPVIEEPTRAKLFAVDSKSSRSSPKTLIATSERTPVTISATRAEIGCAMTTFTPGIALSFSRIASWIVS